MSATMLVTGGTGTLGRHVVPLLSQAGIEVRVLSRADPTSDNPAVTLVSGDLTTGEGVPAAVDGVSTILHLAGSAKGDEVTTATLVRAATAAGSPLLVFISVVGADRVPVRSGIDRMLFGYYAAKSAAEDVVAGSGLPWTTLRATQFHEFVITAVEGVTKLPVSPVFTGVRFQPVEVHEVAQRLVELAMEPPLGLVPDFAGPAAYSMHDLVRGYLRAAGRRRLVVPVRLPGAAAQALRDGANLNPDRAVGRRTWEDFQAEHVRR